MTATASTSRKRPPHEAFLASRPRGALWRAVRGASRDERSRRIAAGVLAVGVWIPCYGVLFAMLGASLARELCLWTGAALVTLLALLRLGLSPAVCGWLYLATLWAAVVSIALVTGGIASPAAAWFAALPLLSLRLLGTRGGIFWTVASLAALEGLQAATWQDFRIINQLDPAGRELFWVTALAGLIGGIFLLVFVLRRAEVGWQQALRASLARAEAANRGKSEFLAAVSDDIRNPLTAILGFAEALGQESDDPRATLSREQALDAIRRNGQRLLEMVTNVLDLARIDAGLFAVDRIACAPVELVRDAVDAVRAQSSARKLLLTLGFDGPVPAAIHTDPARLRQILVNLLDNAIKFTERGGIQVSAGFCPNGSGGQFYVVVTDTGIGMSKEQIAQACEPFAPVDASVTRRFVGSGLGLALCKRLAVVLGGDLTIDSKVGVGSAIRVAVDTGPLTGVDLIDLDERRGADSAARAGTRKGDLRLSGRVLLAEDGLDNQRLISFLLAKAGADVSIVDNGAAAVEQALAALEANRPFGVVLIDIQMPVLDGYQATRRLRDAGYAGPIVALSAYSLRGDRERCLAAGCDDFASKPIDRRELLELVAGHLNGSAAGGVEPRRAWPAAAGQQAGDTAG